MNITKVNEWASINNSLSVVGMRITMVIRVLRMMMFQLSSFMWNLLTNFNLSNFLASFFIYMHRRSVGGGHVGTRDPQNNFTGFTLGGTCPQFLPDT